jgi:iron complex outermembrane recepter protein
VIRGPGETIWGVKAVNILTRTAAETKGGMVVGGKGNLTQGGTAQFGGGRGRARTTPFQLLRLFHTHLFAFLK